MEIHPVCCWVLHNDSFTLSPEQMLYTELEEHRDRQRRQQHLALTSVDYIDDDIVIRSAGLLENIALNFRFKVDNFQILEYLVSCT